MRHPKKGIRHERRYRLLAPAGHFPTIPRRSFAPAAVAWPRRWRSIEAHADLTELRAGWSVTGTCRNARFRPRRAVTVKRQECETGHRPRAGASVSRHRSCRSQARQVGRGASALALSEGHLQRRRRPWRDAGTGRPGLTEPLALKGLVGRIEAIGSVRPFGSALRLFLGRRGFSVAWTMVTVRQIIGADAMGSNRGHRRHGRQVIERARKAGRNCCLISSAGAWRRPRVGRRRPPWASGIRRYARFTERPGCSVAGSTRPPMLKMPKSLQAKAKGHLHDIWMAELGPSRRLRLLHRVPIRL